MKRPRLIRFAHFVAAFSLGGAILLLGNVSKVQSSDKFNQPGNILITDQFNNRVIEIDPNGNIVWQFGSGPGNTTLSAIIGTNDAERVNDLTLMSGTGIPLPPPPPRIAKRAVRTTVCSSSTVAATSSGNTGSSALFRTPICISPTETTTY